MLQRCVVKPREVNIHSCIKPNNTLVLDHGFIHSFYFEDPNGFHLECSATIRGYNSHEYDTSLLDRKVDVTKVVWNEAKQIESAKKHAEQALKKAKL